MGGIDVETGHTMEEQPFVQFKRKLARGDRRPRHNREEYDQFGIAGRRTNVKIKLKVSKDPDGLDNVSDFFGSESETEKPFNKSVDMSVSENLPSSSSSSSASSISLKSRGSLGRPSLPLKDSQPSLSSSLASKRSDPPVVLQRIEDFEGPLIDNDYYGQSDDEAQARPVQKLRRSSRPSQPPAPPAVPTTVTRRSSNTPASASPRTVSPLAASTLSVTTPKSDASSSSSSSFQRSSNSPFANTRSSVPFFPRDQDSDDGKGTAQDDQDFGDAFVDHGSNNDEDQSSSEIESQDEGASSSSSSVSSQKARRKKRARLTPKRKTSTSRSSTFTTTVASSSRRPSTPSVVRPTATSSSRSSLEAAKKRPASEAKSGRSRYKEMEDDDIDFVDDSKDESFHLGHDQDEDDDDGFADVDAADVFNESMAQEIRQKNAGQSPSADTPHNKRRTRHPPLEYWRNERPEFARTKEGSLPTVVNLIKTDDRPLPPHKLKYARPKRGSEKLGPVTVHDHESNSTFQWRVAVNDTMIEYQALCSPTNNECSGLTRPQDVKAGKLTDDFSIGTAFVNDNFSSGVLHIQPSNDTFNFNSNRSTEVYHVLSGKVEVTLNSDTFPATKGTQFFIPPYNDFSFYNPSATVPCKLCYFRRGPGDEDEKHADRSQQSPRIDSRTKDTRKT